MPEMNTIEDAQAYISAMSVLLSVGGSLDEWARQLKEAQEKLIQIQEDQEKPEGEAE